MYSTENYTRSLVTIYTEKESLKKSIYIYITESFCCTLETNTTLQINYTPILKNKEDTMNFWRREVKSSFKYIVYGSINEERSFGWKFGNTNQIILKRGCLLIRDVYSLECITKT